MSESGAQPARFLDRRVNVYLLLCAIIILALLLFIPTLKMGLWVDECISMHSASAPDVQTVVSHMYGRTDDQHPPLFHIILFYFMKAFGTGEIAVRIPSLVCGLLLLPALYWLGKTVHPGKAGEKIGLLAAFFAAISPYGNYFGCQSRPYELATLFTTISLALFCKMQSADPKSKGVLGISGISGTFILFVLITALLFYTHYMGCLVAPVLGFASIAIFFQQRKNNGQSIATAALIRNLSAIALASFLLLPWVPSILQQAGCGFNQEKTPLYKWPEVFAFNLLMMAPLPTLFSIWLSYLVVPVLVIIAALKAKAWSAVAAPQRLREQLLNLPAPYVVMLAAVLIPSLLIGIVTPWWKGYFRYIYSFSPAEWILLAALLYLTGAQRLRGIPIAATIVLLIAVDVPYLLWFDSKPQSGLRTVAQDALAGKYDNCAILMAPDYIGETLGYYLTEADRQRHHILVCGYPRFNDPFTPCHITDLARLWGPPEIVADTEKRIAELPAQGYKYLAFCKDSDSVISLTSTAAFPKLTRIRSLAQDLDKTYQKRAAPKEYAGVTENVTITLYQL